MLSIKLRHFQRSLRPLKIVPATLTRDHVSVADLFVHWYCEICELSGNVSIISRIDQVKPNFH